MSILWDFDKYAKIEELPFDPLCINAGSLFQISDVELLLKAGTPLVLAVEEEDEGGGEEVKGAVKKGATKVADTPSYTLGTVHVLDQESAPTCFAAEDYHFILTNAQQPKLVKCVTKGYIEKAKVLEAMGAEEDPTADWAESLAALGLYLVDELGALPGSSGGGGSGGGGVLYVPLTLDTTDPENPMLVAGKTLGEMKSAVERGLFVYTTIVDQGSVYGVVPLESIEGSDPCGIRFANQASGIMLYATLDDDYPTNVEPDAPGLDS